MLTSELILEKCKTDNLKNVTNINLWGSELKDISILKDLPNVEVISLSVNCITSLKPFSFCKNLKELYLRKNQIESIEEINHLKANLKLKILWLGENPVCQTPNYRLYVIYHLSQLSKLDNVSISQNERDEAAVFFSLSPSKNISKIPSSSTSDESNLNYKNVAIKGIINESPSPNIIMNKSGINNMINNMNKSGINNLNTINKSGINNMNVLNKSGSIQNFNLKSSTGFQVEAKISSNNKLPIINENYAQSINNNDTFVNKNENFNEYTHRNNKILHNPSIGNLVKDNTYDHAETIKNFNGQRHNNNIQQTKKFEQSILEDTFGANGTHYYNDIYNYNVSNNQQGNNKFNNIDYNNIYAPSNLGIGFTNQSKYPNNYDPQYTMKSNNNLNEYNQTNNNIVYSPNMSIVIAIKSLLGDLKLTDLLYLRKIIEDKVYR